MALLGVYWCLSSSTACRTAWSTSLRVPSSSRAMVRRLARLLGGPQGSSPGSAMSRREMVSSRASKSRSSRSGAAASPRRRPRNASRSPGHQRAGGRKGPAPGHLGDEVRVVRDLPDLGRLPADPARPLTRRICRTLSRLTDAITPESARYDASPADPLQTSAFGHRDRLDKYLRETSYHRLRDSARKQPVPSQSKINYTNNDLGRSGSRCCVIAEQPCVR